MILLPSEERAEHGICDYNYSPFELYQRLHCTHTLKEECSLLSVIDNTVLQVTYCRICFQVTHWYKVTHNVTVIPGTE
jgi:hypothetical protein